MKSPCCAKGKSMQLLDWSFRIEYWSFQWKIQFAETSSLFKWVLFKNLSKDFVFLYRSPRQNTTNWSMSTIMCEIWIPLGTFQVSRSSNWQKKYWKKRVPLSFAGRNRSSNIDTGTESNSFVNRSFDYLYTNCRDASHLGARDRTLQVNNFLGRPN